jgi:hypothetical protein
MLNIIRFIIIKAVLKSLYSCEICYYSLKGYIYKICYYNLRYIIRFTPIKHLLAI